MVNNVICCFAVAVINDIICGVGTVVSNDVSCGAGVVVLSDVFVASTHSTPTPTRLNSA